MAKQDMNEEHKYAIAHYVPGLDNKINDYIFQTPGGMDALEYAGEQLGEEYAKGLDDGKAELAKQFAMLEVQGLKGDFGKSLMIGVLKQVDMIIQKCYCNLKKLMD